MQASLVMTVPGLPMGKPRMTRSDKWNKRDCVMRYRSYADLVRASAGTLEKLVLPAAVRLTVVCFFPVPIKKRSLAGQPHGSKPDSDNVLKSVADALFANDQLVAEASIKKFWDDGQGPRTEIRVDLLENFLSK